MRSSMSVTPPVSVVDEDAARLAELGYKQELHRGMSGFSNFAVSFSIISVLAGCITSFGIAMSSGGPIASAIGPPELMARPKLVMHPARTEMIENETAKLENPLIPRCSSCL